MRERSVVQVSVAQMLVSSSLRSGYTLTDQTANAPNASSSHSKS